MTQNDRSTVQQIPTQTFFFPFFSQIKTTCTKGQYSGYHLEEVLFVLETGSQQAPAKRWQLHLHLQQNHDPNGTSGRGVRAAPTASYHQMGLEITGDGTPRQQE